MRRAVPLASLTSGRCFTLAEPAAMLDDEENRFKVGRSILQANMVWKVVEAGDGGVSVESALAESTVLPGATSVVEVPREGFERLAARARTTEP